MATSQQYDNIKNKLKKAKESLNKFSFRSAS
jgi:hypothetical protein